MKTILEIKGLTVAYDDTVILDNVNLTVCDSDFIGVIGPNGGGKTTLLKAILGLVEPQAGSIRFPEFSRSAIGYLPQINNIDQQFPITVFDVVRSGLAGRRKLNLFFSKEDNQKTEKIMDDMGILDLIKRPIGELSGGQMQRVFLARALISDPRLLILDEPNTFVDNRFEFELYEQLKQLNEKMAIILVSHDLGTIASYVKTMACVNRELHYHTTNIITEEQLEAYNCPIQIITHGQIPHTVLKKHDRKS